jgi:hypothetical protein
MPYRSQPSQSWWLAVYIATKVWYDYLVSRKKESTKEPQMTAYARQDHSVNGYTQVRPGHYVSNTAKWATKDQINFLKSLLTTHSLYDGHYDRLWKLLEVHEVDVRTPGDGTRMTSRLASDSIDWVKRQIAKAAGPSWQEASLVTPDAYTARRQAEQATAATPVTYTERAVGGNKQAAGLYPVKPAAPVAVKFGVYSKDGEVYLVTPSKSNPDRVYAKKLVESAPRLTEDGEVVDFEWEFAPGIVWKLTEADRMSIEDASKLSIKYGKCLKCRKTLKAASTMKTIEETGIALGPVCRKYFAV